MQTTEARATQPATLETFAYSALKKHFKKFVKYEAEVLQDKDPEALHQMRVGMRRLRTTLQVFGFVVQLPKAASDRTVREISHILGAVRDLDVLEAELKAQQQADLPKSEQAHLETLLKKMHKRRKQDFDALKRTLKGKKYQDLKAAFEAWVEKPRYAPLASMPISQVLPDLLLPLVSEILLHPAWLVSTTFENGKATVHSVHPEAIGEFLSQNSVVLHDLRKQMKRVRYQTELFVDFYDGDYAAQVEEFKLIQEVLGQIQDSAVLQEYLANELETSLPDVCPTLAKQLDQKVAQAWEQWQTLQKRYLQPEFRTALRSQLLKPSTSRSQT